MWDRMATDDFGPARTEGPSVDEMVTALSAANRRLIGATTKAGVASVLGEAATDVLDFPGTGVRLYDPDENTLVHQAFGATVDDIETRPPYDVDTTPHGRAFTRGETVVDDIGETDPYDREAFTQTMYVPVGEYGILSAGKTEGTFTQTEKHIAETLARNARVAFDRAVERRDLERSLDRLRDQNERLEQLSRMLAHDIRNPLNVAVGNVNLLQRRLDVRELDHVEQALTRMDQLVDEVLTLVSADKTVQQREQVALGRLAERCWQTVETGTATLQVERDATLDADPSRLRHVFENLFRNSVEHSSTDAGSQARQNSVEQGTTESGSTAGDGPTVWVGATEDGIYVEDDGPGIPSADQQSVFESGYTTSSDGTGFGLSIVEDMVEAHGWAVSVTDGRQGGARFEISGVEAAVRQRH